jgi:hypothetical protein
MYKVIYLKLVFDNIFPVLQRIHTSLNMQDKSQETNKISRLEFLRLLGAGAAGYFVYRAGLINSLFGNARAANTTTVLGNATTSQIYPTSGWLSAVAKAGNLDEDGILMMAKPKPGGYSYRFDPSLFPSKEVKFDLTDTGGFEIKQEGNVKYIRCMSHNPGTGEGSNTVRIHLFTEDRSDADKQKYMWIDGARDGLVNTSRRC